jgi:putative copper resistance protein D
VTGSVHGPSILWSWRFDPAVTLGTIVAGFVYARSASLVRRRHGRSAFPVHRVACFLSGLAVVYVALQSPIDSYADLLLSDHMAQHLLLTMVAAPLLVLGTPITLALAATSARNRRRYVLPVLRSKVVRVLGSPLFGWAAFAVVMWGTHYPPLYDAALKSETIHSLEHLAYLSSAALFWWPVFGLDPNPARIPHAARILYLFLAMPVTAVLGLSIYSSNHVLYPFYATATASIGGSPLSDQHLAGGIMWEGGLLLMVPTLAFVLLDWMRRDELEAERTDARRARAVQG